jgi:hypothetical protein
MTKHPFEQCVTQFFGKCCLKNTRDYQYARYANSSSTIQPTVILARGKYTILTPFLMPSQSHKGMEIRHNMRNLCLSSLARNSFTAGYGHALSHNNRCGQCRGPCAIQQPTVAPGAQISCAPPRICVPGLVTGLAATPRIGNTCRLQSIAGGEEAASLAIVAVR